MSVIPFQSFAFMDVVILVKFQFDLSTSVKTASRVEEDPKCKEMKYNITTYRYVSKIIYNK